MAKYIHAKGILNSRADNNHPCCGRCHAWDNVNCKECVMYLQRGGEIDDSGVPISI